MRFQRLSVVHTHLPYKYTYLCLLLLDKYKFVCNNIFTNMQSIAIEQLINGMRGAYATVPLSEKYKLLQTKAAENTRLLRTLLADSPALLAQMGNAVAALEDAYTEFAIQHLKEGLRFGILLGMEIAQDTQENRPD